DSTDDPTHGAQEGTAYHGYYGQHMYHPLLIFDGDTAQLITALLRPGNAHASRGVRSVLRVLVPLLRAWHDCPSAPAPPGSHAAAAPRWAHAPPWAWRHARRVCVPAGGRCALACSAMAGLPVGSRSALAGCGARGDAAVCVGGRSEASVVLQDHG